MSDLDPLVVLAIVDAVLVALFFLFRVLPWSRPGPWRTIWLIAAVTALLFIASELVALATAGTALALEHQIPLFGAIFAVSAGFILVYLSGQRVTERALSLAETDPLTQLGNARAFDSRHAALHRRREPFALLYVDLDGLKRVNDGQGHAAGDELLRRTAGVLRSSLRRDDLAARLGGDEFGLLLRGADAGAAVAAGERIIAGLARSEAQGPSRASASVGVVAEAQRLAPVEAIRAADQAMYRAKSAGGGRLALAGAESATAGG